MKLTPKMQRSTNSSWPASNKRQPLIYAGATASHCIPTRRDAVGIPIKLCIKMKRPLVLCAASLLQWSSQSTSAFSIGDIHHTAPILSQPSLLQDSVANLVSSSAAIAPIQGLFQKYMSTLASHPLPTKMLTGAALATAGDAIAQGREDDDYNAARGASFAAFDSTYRAAQHYFFLSLWSFATVNISWVPWPPLGQQRCSTSLLLLLWSVRWRVSLSSCRSCTIQSSSHSRPGYKA